MTNSRSWLTVLFWFGITLLLLPVGWIVFITVFQVRNAAELFAEAGGVFVAIVIVLLLGALIRRVSHGSIGPWLTVVLTMAIITGLLALQIAKGSVLVEVWRTWATFAVVSIILAIRDTRLLRARANQATAAGKVVGGKQEVTPVSEVTGGGEVPQPPATSARRRPVEGAATALRTVGMSADRFRLAIFVLIVMVLVAVAWAVQWHYVTAGEGALMRFNRFTGRMETYTCNGVANGRVYAVAAVANLRCEWLSR